MGNIKWTKSHVYELRVCVLSWGFVKRKYQYVFISFIFHSFPFVRLPFSMIPREIARGGSGMGGTRAPRCSCIAEYPISFAHFSSARKQGNSRLQHETALLAEISVEPLIRLIKFSLRSSYFFCSFVRSMFPHISRREFRACCYWCALCNIVIFSRVLE